MKPSAFKRIRPKHNCPLCPMFGGENRTPARYHRKIKRMASKAIRREIGKMLDD